jgi:hypothetical protein
MHGLAPVEPAVEEGLLRPGRRSRCGRLSAIGAVTNHHFAQENDMPDETILPTKPTIADIVMDRAKHHMSTEDLMAAIEPAVSAHYPDMTPEQRAAAIRAELVAWFAQLDEPGFFKDLEAAAALDPDWHDNGRSIGPNPGALHDTPQKLVAAYRAWNDATLPVEDLFEVLMRRAIPRHAKPGDAESIAPALMQMVEAHPRRAELLKYGVEQARRAGLLGKAKRV